MRDSSTSHEIAIVVGSHRLNSQSRKVADQIVRMLGARPAPPTMHLLDLSEISLPLWDEGVWAGEESWIEKWGPISETLHRCSGFVIITPEWSGMAPPILKNFFLLCSGHELAHKAGLLVSVSSGLGGSYPIAELRMSSYKNTRICYMPDQVIVRNVNSLFNGEGELTTAEDKAVAGRLGYTLDVFLEYVQALSLVRDSGVLDFDSFPYGL